MSPYSDNSDEETSQWCGFRLVGDNIDKTIKPRDMRLDHQSKQLHYFHVYAMKDRINFRHLENRPRLINPEELDLNLFLPSAEDAVTLAANYQVLITRILAQRICGVILTSYMCILNKWKQSQKW